MDSSKQVSQVLLQSDEYPEPIGVRDVRALEGLRARVVFTDGSERTLDLDPYLRGPLFEPIRRSRTLFASVYVDPDPGTLTWPNGADIDPDVLYYDGNPPWMVEAGGCEALPDLMADSGQSSPGRCHNAPHPIGCPVLPRHPDPRSH